MNQIKSNQNNDLPGFTLVELSIVLIVIGFVISGVSYGLSLIKSASLNSVISEQRNFQIAIKNFYYRFNALPGDFTQAGSYWPSCDATPANCNGNGDGAVYGDTSSTMNSEAGRFWQHLSLSTMLAESYTIALSGGAVIPGVSAPRTAYKSLNGYSPFYSVNSQYGANYFFLSGRNPGVSSPFYSDMDIMSPNDCFLIDSKIDNGKPNTGLVVGKRGKTAASGAASWSTTFWTGNTVNDDYLRNDNPGGFIGFSFNQ
jgi:prepilin-type N-terminal cleavage/methylation domain-containing protein